MSALPDVTVTVIVYNDADRLPRAVASLREQTHANIEIIISDDCSTDHTPEVARQLESEDRRVRYLRLPVNSGGCSAPRNRAMEIARAPYLMFLDSDDELPPRAVELLLEAHREREIDFAMGQVERVRVDTGKRTLWMPDLVAERRTVEGIDAEPRLLFEHLSTSKMYTKDFLDRHELRFPEGIHYEDQLFSAQAYCLARAFTIVPEPVYRWYIEPFAAAGAASISNQRHKISNVRDRIHVQTLIDEFLVSSGHAGLREDKDYKFLKHDFRMYAGDLPFRDEDWIRSFAGAVVPYLESVSPAALARLPRAERVVIQLLRDGRLADAQIAARGMGHGVAPRETVTDETGRVYWGARVPVTEQTKGELDLSDEELVTRPFTTAHFRHEITSVTAGAPGTLDLTVRTYDPGRQLAVGPHVAALHIAPGGRRHTERFRLDVVGPGVYEGSVRLDLSAAELPLQGFSGVRHPILELEQDRQRNTGLLLAPLEFTPLTTVLRPRFGVPHRVTVEPEGRNSGRLQVRWAPVGAVVKALRPVKRRAGALRKLALR
ncbi:glycosyltransferase family 2 protein [Streptomyces sp. YC504]|uniref:Glycosyltransferase family 2 protein n=1 Tax=Streptomyces mesophilus TaxID=1775132 RepID=A0A6G4XI05_9ACTN|nr:glycosyltransferase family 2 protein [Streptomyces mesophilus]NGO76853.1 glycosyltransferase family 2 protein [Streptomyces mesophilus]